MQLKPLALIKGAATFLPPLRGLACGGTGGTVSARYCYGVWLRHLVLAERSGIGLGQMRRVAELGPGESLGIGLAAVLCGVNEYLAFDAKPHAASPVNERIVGELVELFRARAPIPDASEFPGVRPLLHDYGFPHRLLPDELLEASLAGPRVEAVRRAIRGEEGDGPIRVAYVAPWDADTTVTPASIDTIYSQAVLEHVEDIEHAYRAMYRWLRPGGLMTHAIDYKCHGLTRDWNGHWSVEDLPWKIVRGKRPYLINRHPHSRHLEVIRSVGFDVKRTLTDRSTPLERGELARRFRAMSDEDLETSGAFVQAIRPL